MLYGLPHKNNDYHLLNPYYVLGSFYVFCRNDLNLILTTPL